MHACVVCVCWKESDELSWCFAPEQVAALHARSATHEQAHSDLSAYLSSLYVSAAVADSSYGGNSNSNSSSIPRPIDHSTANATSEKTKSGNLAVKSAHLLAARQLAQMQVESEKGRPQMTESWGVIGSQEEEGGAPQGGLSVHRMEVSEQAFPEMELATGPSNSVLATSQTQPASGLTPAVPDATAPAPMSVNEK